jgi:hypothetical protein
MIEALTEAWIRNDSLVMGSCVLLLWTILTIFISALVFDHRGWMKAKKAIPSQLREEISVLRRTNQVQAEMLKRYQGAYMKVCEERLVSSKLAELIQTELKAPIEIG